MLLLRADTTSPRLYHCMSTTAIVQQHTARGCAGRRSRQSTLQQVSPAAEGANNRRLFFPWNKTNRILGVHYTAPLLAGCSPVIRSPSPFSERAGPGH